jgi:uroporphyrinogen decarboxylase
MAFTEYERRNVSHMTSRERVMLALDHKEADRVPLDIGGINNTTMHAVIEKELKKRLGLKDNGTYIQSISQGVVVPDDSVLEYFGADTRSIYINEIAPWRYDNEKDLYYDQWNIGLKLNPDGYYYNMYEHPLASAETIEDLDSYHFFEPNERIMEGIEERVNKYYGKYCVILDGFREQMVGLPSWLRGNENFYIDLVSGDGMAEALLEKTLNHFIKWIDFVLDRIGDKIDIVKVGDDMGTQQNTLMSLQNYREIVKPYQAALYKHIKEKCHCKLLLHCCGAIRPFINDLIEIGVDAINPVQISANNMVPWELKKEFGDRITFWGGGVDTQKVLQFGTVKEVIEQVKANIGYFKGNGGYVFAQVHNIMPGVPLDNIIAMYETYREYAGY